MTNAQTGTDESHIRRLIDDRARAVGAKDVAGAMANVAPDIVSFDVVNPLRHLGAEPIRRRTEEWFSSFQGPIGYELRDLSITAGDGVAFSHSLFRVSGTLIHGGRVDMWVRSTGCYRKVDGRWMLTHEHDSVPFDAETGKASLDLEP